MRKVMMVMVGMLFCAGCGNIRFAPSEEQKQNAWVHNRTAAIAAQEAATAIEQSKQRPDVWTVADSGLELAIAIAGLFGGAYATRVVKFLQEAKAKSNAMKEIVLANEIFKKTNPDAAEAFKDAQSNQSPLTKQIVVEMKS